MNRQGISRRIRYRRMAVFFGRLSMIILLTLGTGLETAAQMGMVWAPRGITMTPEGKLLITDGFQKAVWQLTDNTRTIYAGQPGQMGLYGEPEGGYQDGRMSGMLMKAPWDIVPYLNGYVVSDTKNHVIRYLAGGEAMTLAGSGVAGYYNNRGVQAQFSSPTGLAADEKGNLYIADTGNDAVRRISPGGRVDTYARGFSGPTGLYFGDGVLYVADTGNHRIMKVVDGTVSWVAGTGQPGFADGTAAEAEFSSPQDITAAEDGTIYVSDTGNGVVRKIAGEIVSTMPVSEKLRPEVSMISPGGLLVQGEQLYVCDSFVRTIFILDR